jgi:hypothetical protein
MAVGCAALIGGCNEPAPGDTGFDFNPTGTGTDTDATTNQPTSGEASSGGMDTDNPSGTDSAGSTGDTTDTDGPSPTDDIAKGTIRLGEMHPATVGDTNAILNATFIPNVATQPQDCSMDVMGCNVVVPPTCQVACVAPAVCTYNDMCMPECIEPCSLVCAEGEECYYPFPGAQACRAIETFDAGRLDFLGTNQPITLFPPYQLDPTTVGALASPDDTITVMATGAAAAGFGPFEAMVTTSESIFSNIDMILPTEAFGTGPMTVTWMAGVDDISISLTVTGAVSTGTVVCEADDTTGMLAIPRAAIDAAIPMDTAASMAIQVQRTHTETTQGLETVGQLLNDEVQSEGVVDFQYVSIETFNLVNM